MKMKDQMMKLKDMDASSEGRILTIYMNTEPNGNQQDAWKIRLKNGLKSLREYLDAEGNKEQLLQYQKAQKIAEKTIEENLTDLKPSWVLVISASSGVLFFETLQVPVPNAFYWEEQPHLQELDEAIASYPPMG